MSTTATTPVLKLDMIAIDEGFREVQKFVFRRFKKNPDVEALLMLIGHRELGLHQSKFTKEQKQELMHVGVCTLLSEDGYYEFEGLDEDGWPHFRQLKPMPEVGVDEQEYLLKQHIIRYFEHL